MRLRTCLLALLWNSFGLVLPLGLWGQCLDTVPATAQIISTNTVITTGQGVQSYLVCPGVTVTYSGPQSVLNKYYLEPGAKLVLDSYHYPELHMPANAEVDAQHSTVPMPSIIMNARAATGAIFTDTLNQYVNNITWCTQLGFDYSLLPGAQGCSTATGVAATVEMVDVRMSMDYGTGNLRLSGGKLPAGTVLELADLQGRVLYSTLVATLPYELLLHDQGLPHMVVATLRDASGKPLAQRILLQP